MNVNKYLYKVFLEHLSFGLVIPTTIVWQLSKGLTLTEVGFIQAIVLFSTFMLEVPTGVIADKYGRKTSVMLGTAAHMLSLLLLALGSDFWVFLISSVLAGLGWSLISGAGEALVFESLKADKIEHKFKHFMSNISIADEVSTLIGMVLSSAIIYFSTIQNTFYVATGIMFLTLIYGFIALKEIRVHETAAKKEAEEIENLPQPNFKRVSNFLSKHKDYILIMIIFACLYESGRVLWQPQLLSVGIKLEYLGIIYAVLKLFSILGSIAARKVATSKKTFFYLGVVSACIFLLMGSSSLPLVLLGFAAYFFVENITRVLQSDYLNGIAESRNRATFLSANSLVENSFSSSYTVLIGYVGQYMLFASFVLLAVTKLIALAVLSKLTLRKQ